MSSRELLDRIAAGTDTRPGAAAECALAMAAVALEIPLHGAAAGFYWRMWRLAFPGQPAYADGGAHYETLERSVIDRRERQRRRGTPKNIMGIALTNTPNSPKAAGGIFRGLEDPADRRCADVVAELKQLTWIRWYPQAWFSIASRSISAAIPVLTGGCPARFG